MKKANNKKGLTIVELLVATVFLSIAVLAVGLVIADSQRGWNVLYSRVYSDIVTDGYSARRLFDSIVRKASSDDITVGDSGDWLEVHYYGDSDSSQPDRYARFYVSGDELKLEYGIVNPPQALTTQTVCSNVSSCVFGVAGTVAQMILKLECDSDSATIVASAVANN